MNSDHDLETNITIQTYEALLVMLNPRSFHGKVTGLHCTIV